MASCKMEGRNLKEARSWRSCNRLEFQPSYAVLYEEVSEGHTD
jgi:hypothetical protein